MVNLSRFIGKKVRVTLRVGEKVEGKIKYECSQKVYPYTLSFITGERMYTEDGLYLNWKYHSIDIVHVEEIKSMSKYEELEKQVAEMQKEIDRLKAEDKQKPEITIDNAQVGDVLTDGCIVVDKQGSMALLAAPVTTEVMCHWSKEFSEVFDALKSQGFNPSQWFVPTKEQLKLAYKNCKQHLASNFYWSSTEVISTTACSLHFNTGNVRSGYKSNSNCVRAFRVVNF